MVESTLGSLWANATLESSLAPVAALHETDSCHAHHDPVTMYLSLFLCVGLVVSYLPQLVRIIVNKTSQGFSPWFLLLGATSSASSFLNVVALQWGVVRCCSELTTGECAESLLGIAQVGLQWFLFNMVFVLFLVYYPKESRYERAIALPDTVDEVAEAEEARARARRAAKKVASKRTAQPADEQTGLLAPGPASFGKGKRSGKSTDEDISSGSENSDLDSIDSHIAQNYSAVNGARNADDDTSSEEDEVDAAQVDSDASALQGDASAFRNNTSSSAFSRLAPAFWPMWKAPSAARRRGGGIESIEEGRAVDSTQKRQRHQDLLAGAPRGLRRIDTERRSRQAARRGPKTRQRKTEEWSLALALAWVVLIHFVFIACMTLLLVTSLPTKSFPPPEEVSIFGSGSGLFASVQDHGAVHAFGPSSRLLVSRWAVFLGTSAVVLAMGQYLPQIVYTARTRLVGSLSIPMMCLQVPGSAIFVYALALQPGTGWSSLAAFILTGFFQLVLLVLCIAWRIRQHRAGIDDFGRPITMVSL